MANSPAPKLICAQCGYENEPERVYCHNCGTKLDRSVLPRDTVSQQESLAETRRRIRKMTNPGKWRATVASLFNTLVWAALVAALYLIVMPPAGVPTRQQETEANIISGEIDSAVDAPQSVTVQGTSIDISQHIKTRVKGVSIIPFAEAKRTFSVLGEDTITFGSEHFLFGYPVYATVTYRPTVENGTFHAEKVGMHIGRLGIPPQITGLDASFAKLWAPLKREQKLLEKAKLIKITKDRAVLVTKP